MTVSKCISLNYKKLAVLKCLNQGAVLIMIKNRIGLYVACMYVCLSPILRH